MSYCKKGKDSDVYVFVGSKIECNDCSLVEDYSFTCETLPEMLEHLKQHSLAGHKVPKKAICSIKADCLPENYILPCFHCEEEGTLEFLKLGEHFQVQCKDCGCKGPLASNREVAKTFWNRVMIR